MDLTAAVDERNGVTLVELEVDNPTRTTRRVRIQNELDGPLLPPRRHGSVVDGFDEEGVTIIIAAGSQRAVGYACRAGRASPPATIVGSEPCDDQHLERRRAGDVLAALGDPRPPRDAVIPEIRPPASRPDPDGDQERAMERSNDRTEGSELSDTHTSAPPERNTTGIPEERQSADSTESEQQGEADEPPAQNAPDRSRRPPPAVDAWLSRAVDRIERGKPVDVGSLEAVAERAEGLLSQVDR